MEYLLLITGAIMVAAVVLTLLVQSSFSAQSILENNLSQSQNAINTAAENTQIPLTDLSFSLVSGDRNVTIYYSAPGAGQFILVEEEGSSAIVSTLNVPSDFEHIPASTTIGVFGLLYFEDNAVSPGLDNCTPYSYRLRACSVDLQTCIVSDVQTAIPHPVDGCV